jgi:hypothetical protein
MAKIRNLAIASALSIMATDVAHAETYGLFIGCSDYPTPLDSKGQPIKDEKGLTIDMDLAGPVNDVAAMKLIAQTKFGLSESKTTTLTDKTATWPELEKSLVNIIKSVKAGDQVIFYYSGHGGQIPTKDKNETDGLDEVLALIDGSLVVDDMFDQVKTFFVANGVKAVFVFDSCYSGGMQRDVVKMQNYTVNKSKFTPGLAKFKNFKAVGKSSSIGNNATMLKKMQTPTAGSFAFVFAGQEGQPTIDLKSKDESKFKSQGLFTLYLSTVLNEQPNIPIGPLMGALADIFKEQKIEQVPNAEFSDAARAELPIFLQAK